MEPNFASLNMIISQNILLLNGCSFSGCRHVNHVMLSSNRLHLTTEADQEWRHSLAAAWQFPMDLPLSLWQKGLDSRYCAPLLASLTLTFSWKKSKGRSRSMFSVFSSMETVSGKQPSFNHALCCIPQPISLSTQIFLFYSSFYILDCQALYSSYLVSHGDCGMALLVILWWFCRFLTCQLFLCFPGR
jgi:hypothetical protein